MLPDIPDFPDCGHRAAGQLHRLTAILREHVGEALVGVYLHGSLAMECFNPRRSDIDVLVVVSTPLSTAFRRQLLGALMRASGDPFPLEISILLHADLRRWKYPTPYLLHYSESWRERVAAFLATPGIDDQDAAFHGEDPDLAAHITVVNTRGVRLEGAPIADVFPPVPADDYKHSILLDLDWGMRRAREDPVYLVLNACRVLAFLQEGHVLSKLEGGAWGLGSLPRVFIPLLESALESYRGPADVAVDEDLLASFVIDVKRKCLS